MIPPLGASTKCSRHKPDNYERGNGNFCKPVRGGHPGSNPGTSTILVRSLDSQSKAAARAVESNKSKGLDHMIYIIVV